MLALNLLPEQYKQSYALEIKLRFAVFVCFSLCAIAVLFSALLFSVYFFLKIQIDSLEETRELQKNTSAAQSVASLERDIKVVNGKIGTFSRARSEIFPVGPVLEQLSLLIKPGAYLKSMSIDNKADIVNITGWALARDLVLELGGNLGSSSFVKPDSLQDPIQNILKDKKIDFMFSFQLSKPNEDPGKK